MDRDSGDKCCCVKDFDMWKFFYSNIFMHGAILAFERFWLGS